MLQVKWEYYRLPADVVDRLERLERLRSRVREFVDASDTDPGWPMRRYLSMVEALSNVETTYDE